jgi:hypothetical protein
MTSENYPLDYTVELSEGPRNRLTVAFRPILAIPHVLLVGGPGLSMGAQAGSSNGVLGLVASICAIINWFAIVFTGKPVSGLADLQLYYLRWRAKALAYVALLRDEYPPFGGDLPYPAVTLRLEPPVVEGRNRWTVGFRILLVIPQVVVFAVLLVAWFVTAVVGWFAVLFTGEYPQGLARFAIGVMRWGLRIESYVLLLHDQYPPFDLGGVGAPAPTPVPA